MHAASRRYRVGLLILLGVFLFSGSLFAQSSAYVRNEGQWPDQVVAQYAYQHQALWFQKDRVRMSMVDDHDANHAVHAAHGEGVLNGSVSGHVYDMVFGSTEETRISFIDAASDYLNYYLGADRSRWKSGVKQFNQLMFHEVSPGIDVLWELDRGLPKYTYYVGHPALPTSIEITYEGVRGLSVTDEGNLLVQLKDFFVVEQQPVAFQLIDDERQEVPCSFRVQDNTVRFEVGEYDPDRMLYIDPVIIASTYSGSTAEAFGHSATFDGPGNIYSAGRVFGTGYPTDTGSFDLTFNGPFNPTTTAEYFNAYDVCISKYNPDGSQKLYSTYLGGSTRELPHSLITNANGELHVLGSTNSADFPTTVNAFDTTHNSGQDIYVAKFSVDGTQLLGSTFLGGTGNDGVNNLIVENFADEFRGEIVVDDSNQVFIASFTTSSDFPATTGVIQDTLNGGQDGVVVKLNADLSQLLFSTYLGGASSDGAFALKVNDQGRIYVAGSTRGQGLPEAASGNGAFPVYQGGQADAFVMALNSTGSEILYSSYYGTLSREHAFFLELDNDDNAYIFCWSNGNINSTAGKYQGPSLGSYIAKFSSELDTVLWQVGFGQYAPSAFLVDQCTQIYVSGHTAVNLFTGGPNNTMNLTTFDTLNAVNNQTSGGFHLMTLSPEGDSIVSAFFYGPDSLHVDGGTSRFDKRGYVYQNVCDCTGQFPTTNWAYGQNMQVTVPTIFNSNVCDNCVFKIDFEVPIVAAYATVDPSIGCSPHTAQFDNTGSLGSTHFWDFGDGNTSNLPTPTHTFDSAATYQVTYVVSDTFGCNAGDTATVQVTVVGDRQVEILLDTACEDSVRIYASDTNFSSYLWSNGATTFETVVYDTGSYWLIVDQPICGPDTDTARIIWDPPIAFSLPADTGICELGFSIDAPAGFDTYQWNTGDSTNSTVVNATGTYVVTVTEGACEASDSVRVTLSFLDFTRRDTIVCDDSLTLEVDHPGGDVIWNTGDTTSSIVVYDDGTYWATVSNNACFISDTIDVSFSPALLPELSDTFSCAPIDLSLSVQSFDAIAWSTGDTTADIRIDSSGTYWVQVNAGACTDADTFRVEIGDLGYDQNDLVICDTNAVRLPPPGPANATYQWSTGDTVASPVINAAGTYIVTITTDACSDVDTVFVRFGTRPSIDLADTVRTCAGASATLDLQGVSGVVRWSTGDSSRALEVNEAGMYTVEVVSPEGCISEDSVFVALDVVNLDSLFIIANVITPNGDGMNDVLGLRIVDPDLVTNYQLTVYNRWGVLQFDSEFLNHDWDGRTGGGTLVEPGTYFYLFRAETRCTDIPIIEVKDNVTVLY